MQSLEYGPKIKALKGSVHYEDRDAKPFHPISVPWDICRPSDESLFSAAAAFRSLKVNLSNCYHNPHGRGVLYRTASGRLVMYCPAEYPQN
jgi:hypothetical protein